MKKIYFVGDMLNKTGPAIANKSYYSYLKDDMFFCFSNNRIIRTLHYIAHLIIVKKVVISSFSKLNLLLLKIGKFFNKETFYLMHGFKKEEVQYQDMDNAKKEKIIKYEYELLNNAEHILCVSKFFSEYLIDIYPEFKNKTIYINNGINVNSTCKRIKNNQYIIMSVGGGKRQKNNLVVCKAIDKYKINVKYIVVGDKEQDGDEIEAYPFVEYHNELPNKDVIELMNKSDLYIQNSYFETFGIAVMEALECGCDLLVSSKIGALEVLKGTSNSDIVYDVDNIDEIADKILNKMKSASNHITYNKFENSAENRSKEFLDIINGKI